MTPRLTPRPTKPAASPLPPTADLATAAWERVERARNLHRPRTSNYITALCTEFVPLHGDRLFGDDPAIIGGIARFNGRSVIVMGHQRSDEAKEAVRYNFGMPKPEGYRKARRLLAHAEKFGFPVLSFIDTPAADPTLPSEERGQALAIAECIAAFLAARVPTVSVVIGQGGSGGALAIGVTDRALMMENAIYAVAPPEAAASFLKFAPEQKRDVAAAMHVAAPESAIFGVVDAVIPERTPAHEDPVGAIAAVGLALEHHLAALEATYAGSSPGPALDVPRLLDARYAKYRAIGMWDEE